MFKVVKELHEALDLENTKNISDAKVEIANEKEASRGQSRASVNCLATPSIKED